MTTNARIRTRSSIIRAQTKLRRERLLPQPGEVVTSSGQNVSPVQVVARSRKPARFRIIPASEMWGITPDEVDEYLQVSPGTNVQNGDVLLQKKRMVGSKTLESPLDATFYGVNNGRIILQQYDWFELRALVHARVVNAIPQRGIVLEIIGTQIQGLWGSGKEGYGTLNIISETEDHTLQTTDLPDSLNNQIIAAGLVDSPDVLIQLQKQGAAGLITGSLTAELLRKAQQLSFPVIVTDGIGHQGMARNIFFLLQKYARGDVALFAQQPDYWNVRPEIIIPHETSTGMLADPDPFTHIKVGDTVRILRAPYASQVGEVVRLNRYSKTLDIGNKAHGANVRLADDSVVFVPYANLDTIV